MAVVFGALSVPWTFGFEQVSGLPLWPSFIASASFFAAGGGVMGFGRSLAGNLVGAAYGVIPLVLVGFVGGGVVGLSLAVGGLMFVASLHAFVSFLSFTPAGFFGFAALFGVHAAGVTLGAGGLLGTFVAAGVSLGIGAGIGFVAEGLSGALTRRVPGVQG